MPITVSAVSSIARHGNPNFILGVLVIGEGAKILGPNQNGQDILIIAEYLRVKQFKCVLPLSHNL